MLSFNDVRKGGHRTIVNGDYTFMTESLLADLVKSDSLSAVIEEVCHITVLMGPHIDFSTVKSAFALSTSVSLLRTLPVISAEAIVS